MVSSKSTTVAAYHDDLPLRLIGEAIALIPMKKLITMYHESHPE